MDTTLADSINFLFNESDASTSRIDTLATWISELRIDIQLPQDLITEILVRLPVKSLLKFKCVSKSWMSLISNPQFIRSHLFKSADDLNLELLLATETSMKKCRLHSALHEADPSTLVSDYEFPHQSIVGIVNGLLCLGFGTSTALVLWNPVLKKVKHLPPLNVSIEEILNGLSYTYGFGYDESVDDYKVVCLLRRCVSVYEFEDQVQVYSLRADAFKGFRPTCDPGGLYANSKIYWCGNVTSTPKTEIVSLDMASEKFVKLQHPNYEAGDYDLKLGVLSGRLCVLCDYKGKKADLWVMDNKHGAEEDSWSKVVSIPHVGVYPQMPYSHHWVLCILTNGDIVMGNRIGLLVYNWNKQSREIELNAGKWSYMHIAAYVESLVWPNNA